MMLMMFVKNKSLIATYQSHILPPIKPEHNITGQVVCWQTLVRGTVDKHIETFIKESYGREYHSSEVLHQMFNCRMLLYCGGTKMNITNTEAVWTPILQNVFNVTTHHRTIV